jgi:Putative Flp pilus-assembly TadE/G-like
VNRFARPAAGDGDRGSVTLFLAIFSIAAFALLSLLVDGGTAINSRERAADIAEQAARAAANTIDVAALRSAAGTVQIGPGACAKAFNIVGLYQTSSRTTASMRGCDAPQGATQATVTVSVTTAPVIPMFFPSITEVQTATAQPVCGNAVQKENC